MVISPKAWNDIRTNYEELGSKYGHDVLAVMRILDWIRNEGLEKELYPYTSMFDLVISDRPEVHAGENTLRVTVNPKKKTVTFRYDRLYGSTDSHVRTVTQEESIEVLREFLAYKFGVYRNKNEPNQTPKF